MVTVALAPESICALGEVKSIEVVVTEDTEEVFAVGVVSAEQVDVASSAVSSEASITSEEARIPESPWIGRSKEWVGVL